MNPQGAYAERTEKLYESDGLLFEFDARVIAAEPCDSLFKVELDRTAFFPEGGGQDCDVGTLGDGQVSFIHISEGRIWHLVDREFSVGDSVHGRINADVRLRRMQNHGAEHIISGLIFSLYGISNAGFHMSDNEFTIDTAAPLDREMLRRVELLANKIIREDRQILCYYPEENDLAALEYRSKTEISGRVRIVEIEDCDRCACCAPHLESTGQIGLVHIKNFIKYKKGVRLTVAAGEDALDNYLLLSEQAGEIARLYSVQPEDIYDAVLKREAVFSEKLGELRDLREKLLTLRLENLPETDGNICVFEDSCDTGLLRKLVNQGIALAGGAFAAFSDNGRGGYNYVIGVKEGSLSALAAELRSALGGKGGGNGPMITGFVDADREAIEKFFESFKLSN